MTYYNTQDIESALTQGTLKGSAERPLVLVRAEAENIDTPNSTIEHVIFERFASSYLKLNDSSVSHTEFRDCVIHKLFLKRSHVNNVVFKNCKIKSLNIQGANLQGVVFEKSQVDAVSFLLSEGDVAIIESDIHDAKLNESNISWTITNSTLNKIEAFKIGGSITLKDSTFTDANLEFGEMDSFEAYNSTIDALGPGTLRDKLIVNGGKIQWTGIMNVPHADIADVKIDRLSLGYGHVGHVSIRNCGRVNTLGFSRTFFESISVSNCDVGYFGAFASRIKNLSFDNVAIDEMEAEEAQIGVWRATNVQLNGNLEFQHSKVSDTRFDRLTIGRKATLLNEGANFIFP